MDLITEKTKSRCSRRQVWIQKRWKNAVRSVASIGFKKFEEFLKHDEEDENELAMATTVAAKDENVISKRHSFSEIELLKLMQSINHPSLNCDVCQDEFVEDNQQNQYVAQCRPCGLVAHLDCRHYANSNCHQIAHIPNNVNPLRPKFHTDLPNGGTSQESVHLFDELSEKDNRKKEVGKSTESLSHNNVDPIYLALKEGNKMANMRKQSLVVEGSRATSQTRDSAATTPTTPPTESILLSTLAGIKQQEKSGLMTTQVKTAQFPKSSLQGSVVPTINADNPSKKGSTASVHNSNNRCASPKIGSAPNLLSEKVAELSVDTGTTTTTTRKAISTTSNTFSQQKNLKRPPKLDSKLKSFSLDYGDANVVKKGGTMAAPAPKSLALAPNRHAYRVPACKYNSFESDDTVQSSNSASPCPSSICGSTLTLPSNSYAVTHDYYAKFPDEIDLRVGQRVLVTDTSDQDWWQGHNVSCRLGIFPSTCVAHIHCNERVMQVVQNVCLWVGNKNTRLYRDQIVFAQADELITENLVTVRTERDHRVNCPLQYLMSLE